MIRYAVEILLCRVIKVTAPVQMLSKAGQFVLCVLKGGSLLKSFLGKVPVVILCLGSEYRHAGKDCSRKSSDDMIHRIMLIRPHWRERKANIRKNTIVTQEAARKGGLFKALKQ